MAASVPKGDRLPPDWNYSVTRDGRVFFINERLQTTTWLHPLTGRPVQTGNSPAQDLPAGWEQAVTLDGTLYFIDHNTHSTSFNHPLSGPPSIYDTSARSPPRSPQAPLSPTDRNNKKPFPKQKNIKAPSAKRNPTSTVMRRGWLYRWEHAAIGKSWKKRWCVLADFALFVYKDEDETSAVASVLLPSYRINLMTPADQVYKDYGFKLEHENTKTLYFATDNQADLDRWLALLTQAAMMKGQQGFVRETNNNRPRHRSQSQDEEDEMDYLQHPELQRSWKDPGSYRKMQREEDIEPPDPREFDQDHHDNRYNNHQGQPYRNDLRGHPDYQHSGQPPPSNRSSHAGSAAGDSRTSREYLGSDQSYEPHLKDRWGDIRQGERDSMARDSDRNSMSRPFDRDSMSRPYDRDSMSKPTERNSMSRPYERDSISRPTERNSMSRPYERDSMSKPYDRDSMSRNYDRDSISRANERNSMSRPNERNSMSRPYERDSMSRPQDRDSFSRPQDRDSFSRPQDRDSFSRPQDRDSFPRPQDRDSFSRSQDRDSMSRNQDRDSISRPYERDSYARQSDRNSLSRPSDRNSMSRMNDRHITRPHDRNSMSTVSRQSFDPRNNANDSYHGGVERNSLADERDGFYPNRDSISDPRHSYTDTRGSRDVRDPHLEGEDPYARIRDVTRSESQGFVPGSGDQHTADPYSRDPNHQRYGSEDQHRGDPYSRDPGHQRYGSEDQHRGDPYSRDPNHQRYGSDEQRGYPYSRDLHDSHPDEYSGLPANQHSYQGSPENSHRDPYSRDSYSREGNPQRDMANRERDQYNGHGPHGSQRDLHPEDVQKYRYQPDPDDIHRDRLSRASDYSGYGDTQREYPGPDGSQGYPGYHGDRSSRASDNIHLEGRHGDRSSRASDLPGMDGYHGDRSSRASGHYNVGQQGDRGSRASGHVEMSPVSGFQDSHHSAPSYNPPPGSESPRRHPGLTVNIPPTYVNVTDGTAAGPGQDPSPGRPPYPSQMRQEIARDLAQYKTPRTSEDYVTSAENEIRRMQQSPYFKYPSPRDGQQQQDPRESMQDGRERRSLGRGPDDSRVSDRHDSPGGHGRDEEPQMRRDQVDRDAQQLRSAYERVQQLRQSQRDVRKSMDAIPQPQETKSRQQEAEVNRDSSPIAEGVYSPGGSYVKNLDQPEDLYERGSAFRPPSSCTSSIKGDNSTLERKVNESYPSWRDSRSRSDLDISIKEKLPLNDAEDLDGNYIQMTRQYAREIGKSYIQDKWSGSKEDTYAKPQRRNKLPRMMSTVKEDPNMSDREVLTTREIKNLNKKYPLNGGRVRMSISAGDLIGKTHDELVLLLIQLRRNQSALEKAKEFYRQRLSERRPSEREYKKQRHDSVGRLDRELEQDHQVYLDYKTQLEEIENKLEVYKPLINLVDNMVTMGSLYGGDNYMLATQYRKHLLRPDQYTQPRDMLLFSRQHQEKKFVQEIEDEIKQLSAEEVDLEEKLERLYELDRNLQEQSFKVTSFREDKDLLEKALQGILRQQDISRNDPREMSKLVHQQMTIEKELSLVMQQLAEASQQLEETTAENNKIEHEVALLRTKVNGELSRSRSAVSLGGDTEKTKQQMEKELAKVNNIMAGLSAERGRLSQAMSTLRRSSSGTQLAPLLDKDSDTPRKKASTYMVTDLDSMETVNMGNAKSPKSPHLAPRSKSMGDLRASPGVSPVSPGQGKLMDSPDRGMMIRSYAEGLNQPVIQHPVISHQRQESSLATSTDATDNIMDPDDPNSTWDISEADENTKRFFGIIPRERPKVLTVRDVKRQSEQRKEREKMKRGPDDEGSTGWYSVSSSQQIPTDSELEIPSHVRYPSDVSSSYASEISHLAHPTDPGPLYENLPRSDHLERTASVPVLANFNSNPSSRRSSIGLLAPKPFIPYQDRSSSGGAASGMYTARPFFSEMNLSSEQAPSTDIKEVVQTPNSAFSTPVVFQPTVAVPTQSSRVYAPKPWGADSSGMFNVKKSPKGRFMTISSSEPYKRETSSLLGNTLHSSAGDLIMNRTIDNVPDIVKSSTQKVDNEAFDEYTIEREILFRPDKVLIPERYQPDSDDEDLTDAERIERIEKAEKIKRILASQSVHSLSQPDISHMGENIHRKVEIEKQRRSQLLALSQDLAKQVTLKTKQEAAHRRKTWSGDQFAEAFPHGVGNAGHVSPPTMYTQHRSNVLV